MSRSAFAFRDKRGLRASIGRHPQPEAPVKERPILMSAPMVRACLREVDPKTQTRRVVKPQPDWLPEVHSVERTEALFWPLAGEGRGHQCGAPLTRCPYGVPGDTLWVREAWTQVPASAYRMSEGVQQTVNPGDPDMAAIYAAGWDRSIPKWRPSIHMPRWASRITLRITDVRVERLQDISEADAKAEGVHRIGEEYASFADPESCWHQGPNLWTVESAGPIGGSLSSPTAAGAYRMLWEDINGWDGPGSWDANPWVWALSFERIAP
jgi:hypothetical protein